jgi:hypothetical protein
MDVQIDDQTDFMSKKTLGCGIFRNLINEGNKILGSQNTPNKTIQKVILKEKVINRIQNHHIEFNSFKLFVCLNHKNVEKIFEWNQDDDFIYFSTLFFVTKLTTVWEEKTQFIKYDVKKMFLDFYEGLIFLRDKNICHTTIHNDNLAFNGQNWYISGLITCSKAGNCNSIIFSCLKSKRFLRLKRDGRSNPIPIPSDDLWQLILMYVITYYGFNPFQNEKWSKEHTNGCIYNGICQNISVTNSFSKFGNELYQTLNSCEEPSYDQFKTIVLENTDKNIINYNNDL